MGKRTTRSTRRPRTKARTKGGFLGWSGKGFLAALVVLSVLAGGLVGTVLGVPQGSTEPAPSPTLVVGQARSTATLPPPPTRPSQPLASATARAATASPTSGASAATAVPTATAVGLTPEAPQALFVAILSHALRFKAGEKVTIAAQTMPNVQASITVYYGSEAAKGEGLESKAADRNGRVTWTWTVPPGTSGPGRAVVVVGSRDTAQSAEVAFTVE